MKNRTITKKEVSKIRERQIKACFETLFEYMRDDVLEYWDPDLDAGKDPIAETLIKLDKLCNEGRASKAMAQEEDYFQDHRRSLEQYINRGR